MSEGATLSAWWGAPFAGMLLSIAVGPLVFKRLWEPHYGKAAAFWAALTLGAIGIAFGPVVMLHAIARAALEQYLPFIAILTALYTAAGGVIVHGAPRGSPMGNTAMLGVGALLASLIGTTGAAMIVIRPLLRANAERPRNAHVAVFCIFLVGNIGGALSPLGDPPLFLGYLRGVAFFWPLRALWFETVCVLAAVLAIFVGVDAWFASREAKPAAPASPTALRVEGWTNVAIILCIVGVIIASGALPAVRLNLLGLDIDAVSLARDGALIALAALSLALTPRGARMRNGFEWAPMAEVAILFAGIFASMIPVGAMLAARNPAFAPLLALVRHGGANDPAAFFWATGLLSSFLDNAPTYLVFFDLAGGDAARLMAQDAPTLAAISLGAVFMGANTYVGNAPNLMIYAIARRGGVSMPNFFTYILWAACVLGPVYAALTLWLAR